MNNLEMLISEFEDDLFFTFRKDMPEYLPGLIVNTTVYVNSGLPPVQTITKVAEEIGHYSTNVSYNVVDYSNLFNRKQERLARNWSYRKLLPRDQLQVFIDQEGPVHCYDIAEAFEVPEDIVKKAISMYHISGEI